MRARDKPTQGHTRSERSGRAGPGKLRGGFQRAVPPWREGPAERRREEEEEDGERYGRRAGKREVEREGGVTFFLR